MDFAQEHFFLRFPSYTAGHYRQISCSFDGCVLSDWLPCRICRIEGLDFQGQLTFFLTGFLLCYKTLDGADLHPGSCRVFRIEYARKKWHICFFMQCKKYALWFTIETDTFLMHILVCKKCVFHAPKIQVTKTRCDGNWLTDLSSQFFLS